eukprot:TRINITY_DN8990_c0_g1_i1.p1 TRINITY_DN8990_c0_g1~~TRINITY_DN8990_c0_g1_i1.p1  ORF type:complete len:436 (+),score=60.31 TRINITY_DN8990_c0_g1_i1:210-1517(+)
MMSPLHTQVTERSTTGRRRVLCFWVLLSVLIVFAFTSFISSNFKSTYVMKTNDPDITRIMCVGDIITMGSIGKDDELNYRYWLWKMFYDAGTVDDVEWVGDTVGAMHRSSSLHVQNVIRPVVVPPYHPPAEKQLTEAEIDVKAIPHFEDGHGRSTLRFEDRLSMAARRTSKRPMAEIPMHVPLMHKQGVSWDGLLANASWPVAAQKHEGHLGWDVERLAAAVPDMIRKHKPTVILAMTGMMDMIMLTEPAKIALHLDHFIRRALHTDPNLFVYVAKPYPIHAGNNEVPGIIPYWLNSHTKSNYTRLYEAYRLHFDKLMDRIEKLDELRGRVVAVDMGHNWSEFHTYDGIRPNEYGSKLIAARWMEELQPHLAHGLSRNFILSKNDMENHLVELSGKLRRALVSKDQARDELKTCERTAKAYRNLCPCTKNVSLSI